MPWKDKDKPRVKCLKPMEVYRYDMFYKDKAKAEMEFGLMSDGGFIELLLLNYEQYKEYEADCRRRLKTKNSKMGKQKEKGKSAT